MGKRVTVQKPKMPQIDIRVLRDPGERTMKFVGFLPVVFYVLVAGFAMWLVPRPPIGLDLLIWLGLGGVMLLGMVGRQRGQLLKRYPRSRVTGSQYPEVRLQLNQLCRLLDIKKVPETYIIDAAELSAKVRGLTAPYLVISSRLLQVLSPREFEALLGTLVGHVKGRTVGWRTFITTLQEASGLAKAICFPFVVTSRLMADYLEASARTADRIALLLVDGDFHLMTRTIIKLISYSSALITDQQRRQLEAFLGRDSMEAKAEDVEHQMIIGQMLRHVPGLKERLGNLSSAEDDPRFEAQLAAMEERREKLQPAR